MRSLGETKGSGESVPAVSVPETAGSFVAVEVRAVDPAHASWAKPVPTMFRRMANARKLLGMKRMGEMEPQMAEKQ
jgi:hypothetical protein